ncbi:MAG: polyprenyl synthetase family protein [Candidatus Kapaibacteriota bacterium]|jgi:octaprenyl-diphosphate synthase
MDIKKIVLPIENELIEFNKYFRSTMLSKLPLLDLVIRYLTKKKGKQVRPALVLLTAQMIGHIQLRTFIGATMVELLHTATLIHDDVVDQANERRGIATINVAWNNKISVLIGDFLLSKGLLIAVEQNEFQFLKVTSTAVKRMSEGELLGIAKGKKIDITEDIYYEIIKGKTASLMSSCCEIGAISASQNDIDHDNMREYGEFVGIAFQIKDDILDYTSSTSLIGKPAGNDIIEGKVTLPLIYAFTKSNYLEKKKISQLLNKNKNSKSEIKFVIDFVKSKGGLEYAEKEAIKYSELAKSKISNYPNSPSKQSLLNFADFVVSRNK